jgi:hypothetical protein
LNPFRSPSAESDTVEVTPRVTLSCAAACHPHIPFLPLVQDEEAEYEQLKKDVMANTRRLVLEPFIIATAAAVGLNFGAFMHLSAPTPLNQSLACSLPFISLRSQALGRDNICFPIRKKINSLFTM